jgi:ankyrin repeat/SOCS box protein 9
MSSVELVHLLMDFGANAQAKNADGKRPVDLVPLESPLIQIFLQNEGASLLP